VGYYDKKTDLKEKRENEYSMPFLDIFELCDHCMGLSSISSIYLAYYHALDHG
jgi:hypothetical protein